MRFSICILFIAAIVFGCGSAQKSFEKGDYISAFERAVKELRSKPESKPLKDILRTSYKEGVTRLLDQVKAQEASTDPYRYEKVAATYSTINSMYDQLQTVNCCDKFKENYRDFKAEQKQATANATEARYSYGEQAMALNTREGSKQAYGEFMRANQLTPGYKDALKLAQQAKEEATITVFIQDFGNIQPMYGLNYNPFYNQVTNYLFRLNRPNSFTNFINGSSPGYNYNSKRPDQVIQMSFPSIYFSRPFITKQTITNNREVSTGKRGTDGKEIMQTVTAKVTIYTKTVTARAELFYQILDNHTGAFVYSNRAYADQPWTYSWAVSEGDGRALDKTNQELVGRQEIYPPQYQFIFDELTKRMYDDFTAQISQFYRDY
ncbi:hypothetical protein [Solitalea canadensis]|uniref:Uncharacterized protein n=1 Tax=Solitalea canadensis (strain ATCC 29591 / DSM 3403 / JCM 21819 / LMG 8368 / NBRC 15130 / NCIMB 12057 / USAM 9D) TaxID=929556 RepID=H8KLD2_SOLCM|nr:hypothetical protein [Solitalea canadensis]AFD08634.1 hypothetical protein Solca_3630 [Solitalea canadensis DSM 3403]